MTRLDALDESLWDRVAPDMIGGPVAEHILKIVQRKVYFNRSSARFSLFSELSLEKIRLEDIPFSRRAWNALVHGGLLEDYGIWLPNATPKFLCDVRGIGARVLLEIATAVEAHASGLLGAASDAKPLAVVTRESGSRALRNRVESLKSRFPIGLISAKDPRLKDLVAQRIGSFGEILDGEVARANTKRRQARVFQILDELEGRLAIIAAERFDDALARLLAACTQRKHFRPLMRRLGWDGNGGCTLQEAGVAAGVTRERIRQVEKKVRMGSSHASFFPQLDEAIAVLDGCASDSVAMSEGVLAHAGLTAGSFHPYGVKIAAEFCGRKVVFRARMGHPPLVTEDRCLKKTLKRGLASLSDLAYVATLEELQVRLLEKEDLRVSDDAIIRELATLGSIYWLDEERIWFWHVRGHGGSRYLNLTRKVLAVSPEISLEKLREGILRHHRCSGLSLPRMVTARLLEVAGFTVTCERVLAGEVDLAQALSESETYLVALFRNSDNVRLRSNNFAKCLEGVAMVACHAYNVAGQFPLH